MDYKEAIEIIDNHKNLQLGAWDLPSLNKAFDVFFSAKPTVNEIINKLESSPFSAHILVNLILYLKKY